MPPGVSNIFLGSLLEYVTIVVLFLTGLSVAIVRIRDVLRFWFLTLIWPPRRISQRLDRREQLSC